ncbi:F0F1 ATP synthase subunit B [Fusobacterium vincentii]|uniref:F0F1 ATP synthase subunit B n=1 Tax=Fusobacterium TaxID=848 RepID=UPI00195B9BA2|nr:F0F1 ATP synthase subunit B [Fusobacterium nucleatum]VTX58363.1 ATP synthase subunit b, sodium ion specific [Fusobacterium nucleatum]
MPIISIDSTFFWQIINFFLLLFIVKKYFKEPISKIINERKQKIEAELVEATKNKKESEQLLKNAEAQINTSRKEAIEIVKAAQRKAEEEAHNLIKEARENRENILKTTELEVTKIKNDAKEELGREVKNLAAELAEKIIKEKVDDTQEISLIDKFIAEVGEDK